MKFNALCILLLLTAQTIFAQDENTYFNLGKKEYDQKNYASASDYFTKSINVKPTGGAYDHRGLCYDYLKQYQNAIDDYTSAIPYYTDNGNLQTIYSSRGGLNTRRGTIKAP